MLYLKPLIIGIAYVFSKLEFETGRVSLIDSFHSPYPLTKFSTTVYTSTIHANTYAYSFMTAVDTEKAFLSELNIVVFLSREKSIPNVFFYLPR